MIDPTNHRGIAYLVIGWSLTFIATTLCAIRLYTRTILTRSVGSDDFAILVALLLIIPASVGDTFAVSNGFGQHESLVPPAEIKQFQKWTNIDWILAFLCFYFVRASVLLFVLRLLPIYKRWQRNVILTAFALNIAVTLIATVSYGLSCRPFRAWYQDVPNAKCFSKHNLVITNQVNGVLSCVVDITTAIIPQILLWNVQMKKSTKRTLNIIFSLGLITSSLSIARISTINDKVEDEDSTFRTLVSGTCSLVEGEMGIICACGPAIRQFVTYIQRTGTVLPSSARQYPSEDFVKMRRRINMRDLFWFRAPNLIAGRVLDALPVRTQTSMEDVEATAQRSILGDWRHKISRKLFSGDSAGDRKRSDKSDPPTDSIAMTVSQQGSRRIAKRYREWGLSRKQSTASSTNTPPPLLKDNMTTPNTDRDYDVANIWADTVNRSEVNQGHPPRPTKRNTSEELGNSYIPNPLIPARTQQRRA